MAAVNRNIDISSNGFPQRLTGLREARRLTLSDLAEESGLTYRTILDIENGKRRRVQAKTVMLLAEALGMGFQELLHDEAGAEVVRMEVPPARIRPKWPIGVAIVLAALLVMLGWIGLEKRTADATWRVEDGDLQVFSGLTGREMWRHDGDSPIIICERSPWSGEVLLVGRSGERLDGGSLTALHLSDGDSLWTVRPAAGPFIEAFGAGSLTTDQFNCRRVLPASVRGLAEPEVIVYFDHVRWAPSAVLLVDSGGEILRQYSHNGHLYAFCAEDLDGDGRDDVLVGGINNARSYEGGTIVRLDLDNWGGASVDPGCPAVGASADSSVVRFVLPHFPDPFRSCWTGRYMGVETLMINRAPDGSAVINASVGIDGVHVLLSLDEGLRPLSVGVSDDFRQLVSRWPPELRERPNPTDPIWLETWLSGYRRFEKGKASTRVAWK